MFLLQMRNLHRTGIKYAAAVNFMQVLLQNKELQPGKFSAVGYGEYRSIAQMIRKKEKRKIDVEVFILPLTRNMQ